MIEFETKVTEIISRTSDVRSFRFQLKDEVSFRPGQYFLLTIKVGEKEQTKPFSFSNSPTEQGYVEFTKRLTGSDFSRALAEIKVGDWARLKLPGGVFTFGGEYPKIAFLSGGIGITPVRSICKYIADKKLGTDVVLLYGNNNQRNIVFRNDFDELQANADNIRVVYSLLACDPAREKWSGRTGCIDGRMIREEIPDYLERIFYICGPPLMVKSMLDILKNELKLADEKIKLEKFAGY